MLLSNAIECFKEEVKKVSIQFPNSTVTICHIPGPSHPADSLTKLYRDPVEVINSVLYRYWIKWAWDMSYCHRGVGELDGDLLYFFYGVA